MKKHFFKITTSLVLLSVIVFIVNAFLEARRELDDTMQYAATFKISYALRMYSGESKLLPPSFQIDAKTGAKTSWRVLVEPYDRLFASKQYNAALDWNSESNLQLMNDGRSVIYDLCKPMTTSDEGIIHTEFAVIAGKDTLFVADQSFSLDEIADGRENTVVVVQILNSDVPWSEPRDLELSKIDRLHHYLSSTESQENDLIGFEGQYLLFADFGIFQVLRPMQIDDFKALITPKGGETITRDSLVEKGVLSPRGGKRVEKENGDRSKSVRHEI